MTKILSIAAISATGFASAAGIVAFCNADTVLRFNSKTACALFDANMEMLSPTQRTKKIPLHTRMAETKAYDEFMWAKEKYCPPELNM